MHFRSLLSQLASWVFLIALSLSNHASANSITVAETYRDNTQADVYVNSTDTGTFNASLTVTNLSSLSAYNWTNLTVSINSPLYTYSDGYGDQGSFDDNMGDAPNYGGTVSATSATFYFQLSDTNGNSVNAYKITFSRAGNTFTIASQTLNPASLGNAPWSILATAFADSSDMAAGVYPISNAFTCAITLQDAVSSTVYDSISPTLYVTGTNILSYDTNGTELNSIKTAAAADYTPPTLTPVSPATSATLTNGLLVAQMKAADNIGVDHVEFYLDGTDYGAGYFDGTNGWSMNFALSPGTNLIQAQAADIDGNFSPLNSLNMTYLNQRTNANVFSFAEHWVDTSWTNQSGTEYAAHQEVAELNAALLVPGLGSMSAQTWSNLILTLSFGDFDFAASLGSADYISSSQATFALSSFYSSSGELVTNAALTVSRSGNTLIIAGHSGGPIESGNPPLIADFYLGTSGTLQVAEPFTMALQDGTTLGIYTNYAQAVFLKGTNVITYDSAGDVLNNLQIAGAASMQPPTNQIVAPAASQTWSNSVFTATGKAADGLAVSAVWYQLNGGPWQTAATTNGWTNWWATLNLIPGTNKLSAYALDASSPGYCYVADTANNLIRRVSPAGEVSTLAGDSDDLTNDLSNAGYADGPGNRALFSTPTALGVDAAGNIYVADQANNLIRKLSSAGTVSTLAGDTNDLVNDAPNAGYADGVAGAALFSNPTAVTVDRAGNVYVADSDNNLIRKISSSGVVTTLAGDTNDLASGNDNAGYADGTNGSAQFSNPTGICVDGSGNVYVADQDNNLIRMITPAGVVTTLAGDTNDLANNFPNAGYADGDPGTALFATPSGVSIDASGNVYVADQANNLIRMITPAGSVSTLAGDTNDLVNNYANAGYADGPGGAAIFNAPTGVAVDGFTNVYVTDLGNNLIRKISPGGNVVTVAGDNYDLTNASINSGYAEGYGAAAKFDAPAGATMDIAGANVSTTNSIIIVYLLSTPLYVDIIGRGSISPNWTNTLLDIGQNYSITSAPSYGFVFTNWVPATNGLAGSPVSHTNLQFMMVSNLTLQANFVDVLSPTNHITAPTTNQLWSNSVFTVTGTARDNDAVSNVFYALNGGVWTNALTTNGWTNWTAQVSLTPGTNNLAVFAVDNSGNCSKTNSVNFIYILSAPLQVQITGLGSVSPNWTNTLLAIGKNYSITSAPAYGFTFTDWVPATNGLAGSPVSRTNLQFMMVSNLTLQANFVDVLSPTNHITAPATNQLWSNSVFTVTGTARDNDAVSNVFYALNGGGWTNALTTNNWTNWIAQISLTPGTNNLAAFAVDTTGNLSKTNSVNFIYILSAPLQVQITGLGSVSPNWTNTLLPIGLNYSITSAPAYGFTFTNWVLATNGQAGSPMSHTNLQFMMVSNLTLQANFVDVLSPTNHITAPATNQLWSNSVFTVTGTARDNDAVSNVFYALNGGAWTTALTTNGWTNWTAQISLVPGTNNLAAFAVDTTGNLSKTNSVNFIYILSAPIQVQITGLGSVSPNWTNTLLPLSLNYSITSAPAHGFVFTNWVLATNGLAGPAVDHTNLQFMMVSNLTLQANFIETNRPILTITAPTANQKMTNALVYLAGTASDVWGVTSVWYQVNSGPWTLALTKNNWTNWNATQTLLAGTNVIQAYALNFGGLLSATNSVSILSSNAFNLQLTSRASERPLTDGLAFTLQLSSNLNGHLEYSTDLLNWVSWTNFTGTHGALTFRDPGATNAPHRFYRAVIP